MASLRRREITFNFDEVHSFRLTFLLQLDTQHTHSCINYKLIARTFLLIMLTMFLILQHTILDRKIFHTDSFITFLNNICYDIINKIITLIANTILSTSNLYSRLFPVLAAFSPSR